FQAEDGIRDLTVTGVQTCALPIFPDGFVQEWATQGPGVFEEGFLAGWRILLAHTAECDEPAIAFRGQDHSTTQVDRGGHLDVERSEERRVGKEWRSGWSLDG